ncbi:hypothetical protein [Flavobacterium sp.]|uniref:hypothetical protein n=1 Tax=Flavobacterium sp. TaxID=239 RepID=UPI00286D22CF|nr:hypothetical protein [Flavobacterium sp.]
MKVLKNIGVGFLVSFIGSIPLGYLNVIGFEIYTKSNLWQLIYYLLGVLIIEAIVIYATFYFANKLNMNPKLKKWISIFSIGFLIFLTFYFYPTEGQNSINNTQESRFIGFPTFIIGLILSSLNFAQVPFWLSWNLYLVNKNYISTKKKLGFYYVVGTLIGTFFGMLALILGLKSITKNGVVSENIILNNIWVVFLALTVFQIIQLLRKK